MLNSTPARVVANGLIQRNEYVAALSGLRFLAAFAVIYDHFSVWVSPFVADASQWVHFGTSSFGMTLFFVLSGFVIHLTYSHWFATLPSTKAVLLFAFARFARLYPLYLFFLGFCLIRTHAYLLRFLHESEFRNFVLIHALGIQTWYPFMLDGKLSIHNAFHVSWSISTEMFFYLTYPALFLVFVRLRTPRQTIVALSVFSVAVFVLLLIFRAPINSFGGRLDTWLALKPENDGNSAKVWLTYLSPYFRLPEFILGGLFAHLFLQMRESQRDVPASPMVRSLATVGLLTVLLLSVLLRLFPQSSYLALLQQNFLLGPSVGLMIFGMAIHQGRLAAFFSATALVWLGEISYSLYLLHPFVPRLIDITYNTHRFSASSALLFFANFAVSCLMLVALSYGTFKIIEIPFRKSIRALGQRLAMGKN